VGIRTNKKEKKRKERWVHIKKNMFHVHTKHSPMLKIM